MSKQRNLVEKNSENEALFAETCAPCIDLINQNFEQLSLKDKKFICLDPALSRDIDKLFNSLKLDHDLATHDGVSVVGVTSLSLFLLKKKLTLQEIKSFKHITSSLFYTCGASLQEFKEQVHNPCESVLDKTFVKENHSCIKPIETIYYSCKIYPDRCTWCSSKRKLTTTPNSFPICSACKAANKKTVLKKRQRKHIE